MSSRNKVELQGLLDKMLKQAPEANITSVVYIAQLDAAMEALACNLTDKGVPVSLEDLPLKISRYASEILSQVLDCRSAGVKRLLERSESILNEILSASTKLFNLVLLFHLETSRRMLINTRSVYMPLEVGLAWDPILNLPYIPSSAIKGAIRSYFALNEISVCSLGEEELFGSPGEGGAEGILIFFDSYPTSCSNRLVEPDIINPHYAEQESRISEVRVSPRPIVYTTIAPGVRFKLIVAAKLARQGSEKILRGNCVSLLINKLKEALEAGLGAKTSLGYGRVKALHINKYGS